MNKKITMKIAKLVIIFNFKKILLGIFFSILCLWMTTYFESQILKTFLYSIGVLIIINIFLSILASYILYDKSDLYKLEKLPNYLNFKDVKKIVLLHASFDPFSQKFQEKHSNTELIVFDIYGNRHEHESVVSISKKVFPPNPNEIKVNPSSLPLASNSQDMIIAITSLHEILSHKKRVEFFTEAKRVLKTDGVILVSEQMRNSVSFLFFNIGAFHFLSKKKWKLAIKQSKLELFDTKKITMFAEMMIIKKT